MSDALAVSNILLWIALIALGFVVMALTRQIGLLHERLAPVGALAQQRGPEVGEAAPPLRTRRPQWRKQASSTRSISASRPRRRTPGRQ